MKGTTNAQRNAIVDSTSAVDSLTLTKADGTTQQHKVSEMIPTDSEPTSGSSKFVTSGGVYNAISTVNSSISSLQSQVVSKQDQLTFDSTPTENSTNPVTSGGVFSAINNMGGGKRVYTQSLATILSYSNSTITILKEFDIEYMYRVGNQFFISRQTVSAGVYDQPVVSLAVSSPFASSGGYYNRIFYQEGGIEVQIRFDNSAYSGTQLTTNVNPTENGAYYKIYV